MSSQIPQMPEGSVQPNQVPQQAKGFFARFGDVLKKIWKRIPKRISLPAGVALLTFAFLVAIVAVVWSVFINDPVHVPWRHWMTTARMGIIVALVLVIPLVIYRTLKLWIEGDASPYSDIEFAWKAGIQALSDNGMSIDAMPVFLFLGSVDLEREQAIVNASHQSFRVRGVPEGPAPLHWYANPDGIYLFCSDVGCASVISERVEKEVRAKELTHEASLNVDSVDSPSDLSATMETTTLAETHRRAIQPVVIAPGESSRQLERLSYVCHLLRRSRRPYCPLNGVACLIPASTLNATPESAREFSKGIRNDIAELQTGLQFRCPTTAVVVGLEREAGFRELVRRFGQDQAANGSFGKTFDVRVPATPEQLQIFASQVVGVFEDSVYSLFRGETALSRPGSNHLFSLLCKIRYESIDQLMQLLVGGFGGAAKAPQGTKVLFSGCYFAATGARADQQAFVQSVFQKLTAEQEMVEWSRRATNSNRRLNLLSFLGIGASIALFGLLCALVATNWLAK